MCGESIELVFDYWQCIVGRAVINNDKIVSMIFLREFSNSVKGLVYAICFVVNRQNYRYIFIMVVGYGFRSNMVPPREVNHK